MASIGSRENGLRRRKKMSSAQQEREAQMGHQISHHMVPISHTGSVKSNGL
jgi:hypothetical protein